MISVDEMLAKLGEHAKSPVDKALHTLLSAYKDKLVDLSDPEYFHKTFRQTDVTDSGHTDMAIWHLLHASKLFWEIVG